MARPRRIFLLSPAHCGGIRAGMTVNERAQFSLARRLRGAGAPIGEVFAFVSGLYFRGKLAYATAFARPPAKVHGALVITPDRGLLATGATITRDDMLAFARVDVDADDERYAAPLRRDARALARAAGSAEVVVLGSVATAKYVDVLLDVFGDRLRFPREFVGRGDMSRGGLLLRCVDAGLELDYVAVAGAIRRGPRAPKLPPRVRR